MAVLRTWGVIVAVIMCAAPLARADVLTIYGDAHGGGMYGRGVSGDQKDTAFFENAPNGMYGARIAGRFLFLGAAIQHHQYTNGSNLATWTQFTAGLDMSIDLGDEKQKKEHEGTFVDVGAFLGFGLGTGQQVMPPLSNDEITDKAFILEGRFGYGKHLSRVFDLGVSVPVSWGYFLKNGNGATANDLSTHYRGLQGEVVLFLRGHITLL